MIAIIGLGNPGIEYRHTPHNMGFIIVDAIKVAYCPQQEWRERYESHILETAIERKDVILAKPLTFMNDSGKAVDYIKKHHSLIRKNIWVIHDELDLPFGRIKIEKGRNAAGHKGVQSIIDALGANDFWRIRVGIRPDPCPTNKEEIERYLTQYPLASAKEHRSAQAASDLIIQLLQQGIAPKDITFA